MSLEKILTLFAESLIESVPGVSCRQSAKDLFKFFLSRVSHSFEPHGNTKSVHLGVSHLKQAPKLNLKWGPMTGPVLIKALYPSVLSVSEAIWAVGRP